MVREIPLLWLPSGIDQIIIQQIRAANSLLSITHSMKLLLLLSDEAQIAHRRDVELKIVQEERDDAKAKVAALLDELLRKPLGRGQ